MSSTDDNTAPDLFSGLKSYFYGAPGAANQQLRQRIALQMMMSKRAYPKTFGEGLAAIGDALGDRSLQRQILQDDLASQQQAQTTVAPILGGGGGGAAAPSSYAPSNDTVASPVAAIDKAASAVPVSEGGFNYVDAAADAPKPGEGGTTPANYANVRSNNPGAQWPNQDATTFGSTGSEVIGGGNKIAQFPSPVHGAASNFALLARGYTGMPIGQAISKWSGGGRSTVPGYDPSTIITPDMVRDPKFAVPFMKAVAGGEAPGKYPMSDAQWQMAHQWFTAGGEPSDARDKVAAALTASEVPQVNPTASPGTSPGGPLQPAGGPDQRLALNANGATPMVTTDIQPAPPVPSNIRTVPPPAPPPQAAPPAQGQIPPADYIPPEPVPPTRKPPTPMSLPEIRATNALQQAQLSGNTYVAPLLAPLLQQEKAKRELMDKQNEQEFQSGLQNYNQMSRLYQESKASAAKRGLEAKKLEQDLGNMSEPQQKALVMHQWADSSNSVLKEIPDSDKLLANGLEQELRGRVPVFGNKLQDAQYRRARNAANTFVLAFMRDTSGAAYGAKEMMDHAGALLPKLGDDAQTLADKAAQRDAFVKSLYAGMGPQGQTAADAIGKQRATDAQATAEAAQARQSAIDAEMKGVATGPPGTVRTNTKTGAKRQWDGKRWVEM